MFTTCALKLVNEHLIVVNDGQNVLVDTGSPVSFHPSGKLTLGENEFVVCTSVPGVSTEYLSEKVGCEIAGMLGMDIINKMPVLFSLKNHWMLLDDDAEYFNRFQMYPLSPAAGGLLAITISVNGKKANVLIDSGAPISYIRSEFVAGLESEGVVDDFSPFVGDFQTRTYLCEVDTLTYGSKPYRQLFGTPPLLVQMTLDMVQVDGIIGIELFKRFRLQFIDNCMILPPQGI